jgi:4-hydroxy-tetrahydrodipicolinate reductase
MSSAMSTSATRIIVSGASGRMGSRVCALAHDDPSFVLAGAIEARGSAAVGRSACGESARGAPPKITDATGVFAPSSADVIVDFSSAAGAVESAALAKRIGAALLVGTTGLSPEMISSLHKSARDIALLVAPNTSLGVAALSDLVRRAAKVLGPEFSCSIIEAHHSAKKDAPSGTALRLGEAVRAGGAALDPKQIASIRGGDVVGEHTVRFAGPGEYIELTHRATSRDLFVRGALRAAQWLRGREPGWYTMEDALGLSA